MSMSAQQVLELERARQEALRLEVVRNECQAALEACQEAVGQVQDVATQQFAASAIHQEYQVFSELKQKIQSSPDDALQEIQGSYVRIQRIIEAAKERAKDWAEEQIQCVEFAQALNLRVLAMSRSAPSQALLVKRAKEQVEEALEKAQRGLLKESVQSRQEAEQALSQATQVLLDERIRKEVVRGLLQTLKEVGFVTRNPTLQEEYVVLEGRMASGRKARFEVKLDGTLRFDLDGYEGRSCAEDLDRVEKVMRDRYGVKMGPPQIVWKNPDRLSKGAQDLPTSQGRGRG